MRRGLGINLELLLGFKGWLKEGGFKIELGCGM